MGKAMGDVSPPLLSLPWAVDDIGAKVRDAWAEDPHGYSALIPEAAHVVHEGRNLDTAQRYGEPRNTGRHLVGINSARCTFGSRRKGDSNKYYLHMKFIN